MLAELIFIPLPLKAIHTPSGSGVRSFLLTGWQKGWLADKNLLVFKNLLVSKVSSMLFMAA